MINPALALYYLSRELDDKPGEKAAEEQGRRGEIKVSRALACMHNLYGGHYYNDVIVKIGEKQVAQIDHIYICKYGFFVIETKNYSGAVAGGLKYAQWVQVLSTGQYYFYSPYRQNEGHIEALCSVIGAAPAENFVLFVNAEILQMDCPNVLSTNQFRHMLLKRSKQIETLSENQVEEWCKKIETCPGLEIHGEAK